MGRTKSRRKSRRKRRRNISRKRKTIKTRKTRRKTIKTRKNRMMKQRTRNITRPKDKSRYGGGGRGTKYCKLCIDFINKNNLIGKSPEYMSNIISYSDLVKGKLNCEECLTTLAKNRNRLSKKELDMYIRNAKIILPVAENMKKAMQLQRYEGKKYPNLMLDNMYEDMMNVRIRRLNKFRISRKRKNKMKGVEKRRSKRSTTTSTTPYSRPVQPSRPDIGTKIKTLITNINSLFKELYLSRYNLLVEIFKSIEPPTENDYSEYDDDELLQELLDRTTFMESQNDEIREKLEKINTEFDTNDSMDEESKKFVLNLINISDDEDDLNEYIDLIRADLDRYMIVYDENVKILDSPVIFSSLDRPHIQRLGELKNFNSQIRKLGTDVNKGNLFTFQSFLLQTLMNVNNWIEEPIKLDSYIEYNPLMILDKSMDYDLNYYSLLDVYENMSNPRRNFSKEIRSLTTKKDVVKEMGGKNIGEFINRNIIKTTDFNSYYDRGLKVFVEEQFLKENEKQVGGKSWKDLLNTNLQLEDSENVKHIKSFINVPPYPSDISNYFGSERIAKKLGIEYKNYFSKAIELKNIPFTPSPEHKLYLFFKHILTDLPYLPNPTSKPEHEIAIRRSLINYGFVGPRPNMDPNNKKKWYKNQSLKIGEFVEQPNGSTAHPDLWVQLSNLRLSIEAKSNQGYYPMYGKTPPPKETVYIFSSKKTKYYDGTRPRGRTTFTFGHQLLTDNIRNIMEDTKKDIKMKGKSMDWNIERTGENYSSVGLTSDVNIQHIGNKANWWLDKRNKDRERQVLSYNWLQPMGLCNDDIIYNWEGPIVPPIKKRKKIEFICVNNDRNNYKCMCLTHNQDFEQKTSFNGKTFTEILKEPYMERQRSKFYRGIGKNKNIYVCYMCMMKYYTYIKNQEFMVKNISDVLVWRDKIYYKVNWKNYPDEDWRTATDLSNTSIIQQFWGNLLNYIPDLKIIRTNSTQDIFKNPKPLIDGETYNQLKVKKLSKTDLFNIDMITKAGGPISTYNTYLYNLFVQEKNK